MSTYRQYQQARDTAWRALLRVEEKRLPVDVEKLAGAVGMEVLPYPDEGENPRLWHLANQVPGVCVSLRVRGKWHIFVRDAAMDGPHRRFAVAHELGHLLLGHESSALAPGVRRFLSDENEGDLIDDPQDLQDYAADIFAVRLLAPACLLHELRVDSPPAIAALCGLPPRAAALRAERMELLNSRDAFYVNPLERKVRDAFGPYVVSVLLPAPQAQAKSYSLLLPAQQASPAQNREEKKEKAPRGWSGRRRVLLGKAVGALALAGALLLFFLLGRQG